MNFPITSTHIKISFYFYPFLIPSSLRRKLHALSFTRLTPLLDHSFFCFLHDFCFIFQSLRLEASEIASILPSSLHTQVFYKLLNLITSDVSVSPNSIFFYGCYITLGLLHHFSGLRRYPLTGQPISNISFLQCFTIITTAKCIFLRHRSNHILKYRNNHITVFLHFL